MDGKNIADFIDPDIAERLDALEREEEKLAAEGFYDSDSDNPLWDSDDEREKERNAEMEEFKLKSQEKKRLKSTARLPASAKVRTISELARDLTAAGHDPSRIEERAALLAKARGAKRKRSPSSEDGMDVDEDGASDAEMEVDDEEPSSVKKRAKTNSGTAVAKRAPKSNRQLTGLRDEEQARRANKLRNFDQRPRNYMAKAGEADRKIQTKMVSAFVCVRDGGWSY